LEPPKKDSEPTPSNVQKLEQWLTSIIAGHPGATHTYSFYEEIDKYLGPWGDDGYPIGYGKKYNIQFTSDHNLRTDNIVQRWVWKTTIKLQEALRDFIVQAYRRGNLYPQSENYWSSKELKINLKEAAFNSHSKAYVSGGLTIVAMGSPNMIPFIASIPRKEFSPLSRNFKDSVQQVLETVEKVVPEAAGVTLATLAGPAHTLSFQYANRMDVDAVWGHRQVLDSLSWLKGAIRRKEMDVPSTLDEIIRRLNAREFPDMPAAALARDVIEAARERKRALVHGYRVEVAKDPSLRPFYDQCLEGWEGP
jgi:hypothetical protein